MTYRIVFKCVLIRESFILEVTQLAELTCRGSIVKFILRTCIQIMYLVYNVLFIAHMHVSESASHDIFSNISQVEV